MTSRRNFLQTAGAGFAAAALAAFPPSIRRALAIPANNATGTIKDVEHVIILMQENRSFDHYFGTLKGVRGFGDRFTIPLANGRKVWQQQRANGAVLTPFHIDGSSHNAQRAAGTPHSWDDSQKAWDGGRMAQWPTHKNDISMGYFKESEIPFQFALANAFTLCDAYHCSMHTGTDANRSFHLTGTNGAVPTNTAFVNNEWDWIDGLPANVNKGYTWTTYAERLEQAGVSWISYQNMPDEWGDNMLGAFRAFRQANVNSGYPVSSGGEPGVPYANTGQALPYKAYDPATDNAANPLYKGVANTLPGAAPENYLDAFRRDIREGRLPQVSWMNAPSIYCEHPGPSSPVQGAWFLQEVLDALTAVPEVWSKTVLLVNFDENDGYFDHVPSPSAPSRDAGGNPAGKTTLADADMAFEYFTHASPAGSTTQPAIKDGRVYGPGPRVPMFVISPWSRGGWVNSQVFDHTSVLRLLEARFGVAEPNISPWRRAVAGDLTSVFDFATPDDSALSALPSTADYLQRMQAAARQPAPVVPVPGAQPKQEPGQRPARALPYALQVHARQGADGLRLVFVNDGQATAVFNVYAEGGAAGPWYYTVLPGRTLEDAPHALPAGAYALAVHGPNGFLREFAGEGHAAPAVEATQDGETLVLQLSNPTRTPVALQLRAMDYADPAPRRISLRPGERQTVRVEVAQADHWYDLELTQPGSAFRRRLAGHLETGRPSHSDPAIGRVS